MSKKICILGGGESGVGAALLGHKNEDEIFVSDFGNIPDKYKEELLRYNIPFEEKGHDFEKIRVCDLIIKSPGIPQTADIICRIRENGIPIVSEIEYASRYCKARIIGITGSNGKTTTTSLVHHILDSASINSRLAGNVGKSFARTLFEDDEFDWTVIELSSFQLEDVVEFKADIAVVLNISPDHLDRYAYSMFKYASAKWNITRNQQADNYLLINGDDDWLQLKLVDQPPLSQVMEVKSKQSDEELKSVLQLKGQHNLFNASLAFEVCALAGIQRNEILKGISTFKAIEHRLETVAIINGVEYINDSKATNIDSAKVALGSMNDSVVWIAGGTDKGNDYALLEEVVVGRVHTLICLTLDDSKLRNSFKNKIERIESVADIHTCVEMASKLAKNGDQVLLSPACASFDLFDNYEHRGNRFREEVLKMRLG